MNRLDKFQSEIQIGLNYCYWYGYMMNISCGFSRVQLAVCVSQIVKQDFPGKWPGVAEKVLMYLKSERHETWPGALVCLHQLVKHFEYVAVTFLSY